MMVNITVIIVIFNPSTNNDANIKKHFNKLSGAINLVNNSHSQIVNDKNQIFGQDGKTDDVDLVRTSK